MKDVEISDFLGTDILSIKYSEMGLQHLFLREKEGFRVIDLRKPENMNPFEQLLVRETRNFFLTGKHNMPLDLSAYTDFEQRVFAEVAQIERGKILTYKDVATKLGKPGAAQAVGNALLKNPVAYFLPTHRVLPQRGIGICRSGAGHLREKLLEHEGHDLNKLRGNYVCTRKKCPFE